MIDSCINVPKIPTGCRAIDVALEGGISPSSVTMIYGEPKVGKTLLAMQCAASCAAQGFKTLFVDCDGSFSSERLAQIVTSSFKEIAELIILMRPTDFREQIWLVDHLTDYMTGNFALVVFDAMTSLYRAKVAEFPERKFELNRELNRQLAYLAQVAKTQRLAILVTSQVRTAFGERGTSIEPVATRVIEFWADTILAVKPTENTRIMKAILEKNRKSPPISCFLRLDEKGMHQTD